MLELNVAQLIGLIGFGIGVTGLLRKSDHHIRMHMALFGWTMTAHFLLLGSVTSATGTGISGTRSYISTKTQSISVAYIFILLLWIMAIPNIHSAAQIVPLVGTSIATYGFFKTSGLTFRLLRLLNSSCWLFNNILVGSIGGMMSEATFFTTSLFMIIRIWKQQDFERQAS